MKLKLACADFTFPILRHEQVLRLISMLDIEGVDIGLFEERSHLQPSLEFANVRRRAGKLRQALEESGLTPADFFLQLAVDYASRAINQPNARRRREARNAFLNALDYVQLCGGRHLTGLPGIHFTDEKRRDSLSRAVDELSWRVETAHCCGIVFAIEPHIGSLVDTPKRTARLVRDVPGLTLTLDYGHFLPRRHKITAIEPLLRHTTHFHARGANGATGSTSMSANTLNWQRVVDTMDSNNYQGWIELEYGGNNLTDTVLLRDHLRTLCL